MFFNQKNKLEKERQEYNNQIELLSYQNYQDENQENLDSNEYSTTDQQYCSIMNPFFMQPKLLMDGNMNQCLSSQTSSKTRVGQFETEQEEPQGFMFPQGLDNYTQKFKDYEDCQNEEYDQNYDRQSLNEDSSNDEQTTVVSKIGNQNSLNFKKTSYQTYFKQQMIPERLLNSNRKFYLFIDQMIDIDYFRSLKTPNEYANDNQAVQLQKGFRLTNSVIHRIDNKFIEIESELIDPQPESVDFIIEMLKSLGDKDLIKYIKCLQEFQRNIAFCKQFIKEQSLDINFQEHRSERKAAGDILFRKVTSQLDPNKLIFYQRYTVNYEKLSYQTTRAGYSPALYELLDNGSYQFKDHLLKNGFHDPMSQLFRLGECFYRTCYFMSSLPSEFDEVMNKLAELDLITCDNFRFPVTMKLDHHYLEKEYDTENNLDFKFCDLLASYEFTFKDQSAFEQLKQIRKESILNQSKLETIQGDIDWEQFDYVQTEFFNQYYSEQVDNLVKKGNKWYKRCGFAELPTKKVKQ